MVSLGLKQKKKFTCQTVHFHGLFHYCNNKPTKVLGVGGGGGGIYSRKNFLNGFARAGKTGQNESARATFSPKRK